MYFWAHKYCSPIVAYMNKIIDEYKKKHKKKIIPVSQFKDVFVAHLKDVTLIHHFIKFLCKTQLNVNYNYQNASAYDIIDSDFYYKSVNFTGTPKQKNIVFSLQMKTVFFV